MYNYTDRRQGASYKLNDKSLEDDTPTFDGVENPINKEPSGMSTTF